MHHVSIRTSDIYRAIAFYEQLGFQVCERFTAGITLACWMEGLSGRIELLQVPQPRPAADAFGDEHYTGYYHLSFDLTDAVADLPAWLAGLRDKFDQAAQTSEQVKPLKVLLEPRQQIIGDCVYEVVFLADADGLPLEFLRQMKRLQDV
ncbi:MAG TPA: VOC family protein [Coleofasciculaceae cyanobacterium]|jgi:catechol 2,3-dioxygenase-like lactoylglutathione lyase family enzyme